MCPFEDQFEAERKAVESLSKLLNLASECKRLHENAGLPLHPLLVRIFSNSKSVASLHPQSITIPAIQRDRTPKEAREDWISIDAKSASPTTIAIAVMREKARPIQPRELVELVSKILPNVAPGSIYNLGVRLEQEGRLLKGEEGWTLSAPDKAPILDSGVLWGAVDTLVKQDIAAHRREAIIHILKMDTAGLQTVQLVAKLNSCAWVKAPANKDLVKIDMQVLEESGLVRQRGNSRKWEAVPGE